MMGARMIQKGWLDRVIVGGTDSLTSFTISGFRSLMIFDEEWCRPFDETRKGLNLGEGAGFIVLESAASIEKTGKQPIGRLSGWSNASDAYHQTASSPDGEGAILSMQQALDVAQLSPESIDYVNAHGTATPNNDLSESKAFLHIFNGKVPPFSSTKAFTGHTLAASGGIEAVISLLSIQHGMLFPNLNHTQVIAETGLQPVTEVISNVKVNHVLSNSFGFGGNNSTIIISAV
jgi:3-oxoacyl-[acyl-carrier-protein] synthase-1